MTERDRIDFEQAMGEEFAVSVSPPIPFEDGSPHECCEVIWSVLGLQIKPDVLSKLNAQQIGTLAYQFGRYFETQAPSAEQIASAVRRTLARWPVEGDRR